MLCLAHGKRPGQRGRPRRKPTRATAILAPPSRTQFKKGPMTFCFDGDLFDTVASWILFCAVAVRRRACRPRGRLGCCCCRFFSFFRSLARIDPVGAAARAASGGASGASDSLAARLTRAACFVRIARGACSLLRSFRARALKIEQSRTRKKATAKFLSVFRAARCAPAPNGGDRSATAPNVVGEPCVERGFGLFLRRCSAV